jgi:hypothetical protein
MMLTDKLRKEMSDPKTNFEFHLLLNVEESLDLMLLSEDVEKLSRYFGGYLLTIERLKETAGKKLYVSLAKTDICQQDGHTEIVYQSRIN